MSAAPASRVLLVIHNPRLPGGRRLNQALGWNDPDRLAAEYCADVQAVSHGRAVFQVVERVEVDAFPVKADGFVYTAESYLNCWRARSGFHQPDGVDYHRLLDEFDVIPQINAGRLDEVWLFAFPYAGYYESIMAGPGAVWCNAPPLARPDARRRFVVMGFSYERGVGEMLEDLGHRAESLLAHVFRHTRGDANLWERFTRHDLSHPGRAECGNVHFAPNSQRDYDWGNPRLVPSRCDAWLNFPDLSPPPRPVNCAEWGGGDIRAHHRWWFQHFPHGDGAASGIRHNWWAYVVDPNQV
jgi:hypothetical protein